MKPKPPAEALVKQEDMMMYIINKFWCAHTELLTLGGVHLMTVESSKSFCPSRE